MSRIRIDTDIDSKIVSKWAIVKWFFRELVSVITLSPDNRCSINHALKITFIKFTAIK
jgi:hypothetical protein